MSGLSGCCVGFWVQPQNPTFSIHPGEQNSRILLNVVLPVLFFFITPSKCRSHGCLSGLDIYRDTALKHETEASVFANLNFFFFLTAFHCLSSSVQMHCRHSDQLLCGCSISLRPSNGGQDCPGVNYEYQLCHTDDCPKHFEDFRAQQCQLRNSHFEFQNTKHHWLPYEHPDGRPVKCHHIVGGQGWTSKQSPQNC